MKKIIIPILLVFALAATSCEKLLDIPQKGVISYSNFFESDADALAARSNMYASFADNIASCNGGWIYVPQLMLLNYSADDVLASGGDAEDHGDFRIFCEFRYDERAGALKTLYNHYATVIYACNFIISNFSNENRNGVVRKVLPKGRSFDDITEEEMRRIDYMLNDRPLRCLNWRTPREAFAGLILRHVRDAA